jgi:DNA-binding NarL/FixJ family response regulator
MYQNFDLLSKRELEVIKLATENFKNAQIAEKLSISRRTVEIHRSHAMQKLGLKPLSFQLKNFVQSTDKDNPETYLKKQKELHAEEMFDIISLFVERCKKYPTVNFELPAERAEKLIEKIKVTA